MKSAFITAVKAFVRQVKANHLEYCQKVVDKANLPKEQPKEDK